MIAFYFFEDATVPELGRIPVVDRTNSKVRSTRRLVKLATDVMLLMMLFVTAGMLYFVASVLIPGTYQRGASVSCKEKIDLPS